MRAWNRLLPATSSSLATPRCVSRAGPGSRWRLAPSFQQLFQNPCIILGLLFGSKQQGQAFLVVREFIETAQVLLRTRLDQFLQIFFSECFPLAGARVIPATQLVRGREIAQPFIDRGLLLR